MYIQAAGVPSNILASENIPPSSLLCGYGEKVCLLLSALADCLLARRNYKFKKLIHIDPDSDLNANAGDERHELMDEDQVLLCGI